MDRLTEPASKLTPTQLKEVEDFAEFLTTRKPADVPSPSARPGYIDVDAVAGMFAGMGGDKSSVELVHEANEARAAKYD